MTQKAEKKKVVKMRGERRGEIDGGGRERMKEDASWYEKSLSPSTQRICLPEPFSGAVKQLC